MQNYSDFLLSLIKNKQGNEVSFELVKNLPMKLVVNESSYTWIVNYKPQILSEVKNAWPKFEKIISFEDYLVIHYFVWWVLRDFLEILSFLPKTVKNFCSIGSGIGLLDILLAQLYPASFQELTCIELKQISKDDIELREINGIPLCKDPKDIFVSNLLINNLIDNNIKSNVIEPHLINTIKNNKYDLIYSIRSWCFLYDVSTYSDLVKSSLSKNGILICDVHLERIDEFKNFFKISHVISSYNLFNRVLVLNL